MNVLCFEKGSDGRDGREGRIYCHGELMDGFWSPPLPSMNSWTQHMHHYNIFPTDFVCLFVCFSCLSVIVRVVVALTSSTLTRLNYYYYFLYTN